MARPIRVYIAGPIYGSGKLIDNVNDAITVANVLRTQGFIPFVPHLYCFWSFLYPHKPAEYWLTMDKEWLLLCQVLLRLPGISPGANEEEEWAKEAGIPIVYSIEELLELVKAGVIKCPA
jgi:hypothetical protein